MTIILSVAPIDATIIDNALTDIPHLAYPFAFVTDNLGNVTVATDEQDSAEEIASAVANIVNCPTNFRMDEPTFGIDWPEFVNAPVDTDAIENSIAIWEPRANVTLSEYADPNDPSQRHVEIQVS